MSRIPPVTRESVPESLREVFDEVSAGPGGVGTGPMSVLKHSPELARRATPLFAYVRNESIVPHPVRELAMLATARAKDCIYIWDRHVPIARESGLSNELIDSLRDRKPLPELSPAEGAVLALANEFFNGSRVSEDTFKVAHAQFGSQCLVELGDVDGGSTPCWPSTPTWWDLQLAQPSDEPLLPV